MVQILPKNFSHSETNASNGLNPATCRFLASHSKHSTIMTAHLSTCLIPMMLLYNIYIWLVHYCYEYSLHCSSFSIYMYVFTCQMFNLPTQPCCYIPHIRHQLEVAYGWGINILACEFTFGYLNNRPRLPSNLKQMLIFTPFTLMCEVAHKRFNDFIASIKQEFVISRLKSKHFVIQQITFPNVKCTFLMRSFSFEQFPN